MVKIEYLEADGFEAALRGMRNPLNSWYKSDSGYTRVTDGENETYEYSIGPNDLNLCQRLISAGTEHSKFLRQINVSFDITFPLYLAKEFDTYKIGTTANSCSTMHKIMAKEFELKDFSCEHLDRQSLSYLNDLINLLNYYRNLYINENFDKSIYSKKDIWWQIIQLLPSSYNQKRTITMNYAVIRNIIKQRQNHKLDEWKQILKAFKELPYAEELLFYGLED